MTARLVYVDGSLMNHTLSAVNFGGSNAKHIYYDGILVWSASTQTWITIPNNGQNAPIAVYTPTVDMSVKSFSMIYSMNTLYNPAWSIYTVSGSTATAVANSYGTTSTGVTITTGGTLGAYTEYTYTKTYTSPYPALTAGTQYLFWVGDRYMSGNMLSGSSNAPGTVPDWAIGSATASYTANNIGDLDLTVIAV